MNLYLVAQDTNNGMDTFDSFVCVAKSEEEARNLHPYGYLREGNQWWSSECRYKQPVSDYSWVAPTYVTVTYLGLASNELTQAGVICKSFNAG